GGFVADGGVKAASIVEDLDVLEEGGTEGDAGRPSTTVDELGLECGEEGFGHGVVPAVAATAHADGDAGVVEDATILGTRVLAASIGGVHQAGLRVSSTKRRVERGQGQVGREPRAERPSDDRSSVEVENSGKVGPSLIG